MKRSDFVEPDDFITRVGEDLVGSKAKGEVVADDGGRSDEDAPPGNPNAFRDSQPRRSSGDKIALVKFDGTAITTSGKEVQHNWFKGLELDKNQYSGIMITADEAKRLHAAHTQMKIGSASTGILKCYGAALCPLAGKCIYVTLEREAEERGETGRQIVPIMSDCPIETDILHDAVRKYAEDFGVTDEPGNFTDQRIILELAECDVLENRMNGVLSTKYQDLSEEKVVAVMSDDHGEREQRLKDVADAMKVKEKLWVRREKLRKNLVATRFDQYKKEAALQITQGTDPASIQSDLMSRLKRLQAFGDD